MNSDLLARDADVERLRRAFDEGEALDRFQARAIFGIPERRFRSTVSELRLRGVPIVTESTEGSRYRKAKTADEAIAFTDRELLSRARVMEQQARAIREHLADHFVPEQMRLVS